MDVLANQPELAGYFADCLIEEKYSSSELDEASLEAIKQEYVDKINREISQAVFDNLTDDQLAQLEELLEEGDSVSASAFLQAAIPDLRRLIVERLVTLKEENN